MVIGLLDRVKEEVGRLPKSAFVEGHDRRWKWQVERGMLTGSFFRCPGEKGKKTRPASQSTCHTGQP